MRLPEGNFSIATVLALVTLSLSACLTDDNPPTEPTGSVSESPSPTAGPTQPTSSMGPGESAGQGLARTWFQFFPVMTRYHFFPNGSGVYRTIPVDPSIQPSVQVAFQWVEANGQLQLYQEDSTLQVFQILGYDAQNDTLFWSVATVGQGAWYGCQSPALPESIKLVVCR